MSGFWFWSWRWLCVLISSSALNSLDRRRYRHETIMSCLVVLVLVHAVFGQFISWSRARAVWHPGHVPLVCARTDPCLSFTARSSSVSRPHIWRQYVAALSGNWCARRRLRCVSPAGPAPTDRSPGLAPLCWREGGRALLFPSGRPGGRRLSQPLLVWAGPLREPVEPPVVRPRRVISARGACTVGPAQREQDEPWWAAVGPGIFRRASAPRRPRCRIRGTRWGWSIGLLGRSSGAAVPLGRRGSLGRRPRC